MYYSSISSRDSQTKQLNLWSKIREIKCVLSTLLIFSLFLTGFIDEIFANNPDSLKSVQEDLLKINDAYKNTTNFSLDISYKLYRDHKNSLLVQSEKGSVQKMGNRYHSNQLGQEILFTGSVVVTVFHEHQIMKVEETNKFFPSMEYSAEFIKEILGYCEGIKPIAKNGNLKGYRFELEDYDYSSLEIFYDTTDYFLRKVVMYYETELDDEKGTYKPRLEVMYSSIQLNPVLKESDFSEKKFVIKEGERWVPSAAFKSYSISD